MGFSRSSINENKKRTVYHMGIYQVFLIPKDLSVNKWYGCRPVKKTFVPDWVFKWLIIRWLKL